jgi:methylmalonyl-CoA mutase C-terminal domain/subunit
MSAIGLQQLSAISRLALARLRVGLSILSGAHLTLFAEVMALLKERGATDILVFGGGIIPDDDIPVLKDMGVSEIFTPGTTMQTIVDWVVANTNN